MGNEPGKEKRKFIEKVYSLTIPDEPDEPNEPNEPNEPEKQEINDKSAYTIKSKIKEKLNELAQRCEFNYD